MIGKILAGGIVLIALIAGVAVWYLQVYAYYNTVIFPPGQEIVLTSPAGKTQPIDVDHISGIDAPSSPLRFRACFSTPLSLETLREQFVSYTGAVPLVAPGWFECFVAEKIGQALEQGQAQAFLSQANVHADVDRVVAVFPDGQAYAWHQLNPSAQTK